MSDDVQIKYDPRIYAPFGLSAPPLESFIVLDGEESPLVRQLVNEWYKKFDSTWNDIKLAKYLMATNRECQDLSDEELNQFRKDL